MERTYPRKNQITSVIAIFIIGSSLLIPPAQNLGNHAWLSLIFSYILFLFILGIYYMLALLEPETSLFGIHKKAFGNVIGFLINIFYLVYLFVLTTLVTANFVNFIGSVILIKTPELLISALLVSLLAYTARAGFSALFKVSQLFFIYVIIAVIVIFLLLLGQFNLRNLLPLFPNDWNSIIDAGFTTLSFPFGESVAFLSLLCVLGKPRTVFKGFLNGSIIAVLVLLLGMFRNAAILGDFSHMATYPSFETARMINIGRVLTRAEVLVSVNFILAGFAKAAVSFYGLCRGIKETFAMNSFKHLVIPIGVLVVLNAHLSFSTIIQNLFFAREIYRYYALIPQAVLVFLTYFVLLLKKKGASR